MSDNRTVELLEQIKELQIIQNQLTRELLDYNKRVEERTSEAALRVRSSTDRLIKRNTWENIIIVVFLLIVFAWLILK